jgi:hypothetical protein
MRRCGYRARPRRQLCTATRARGGRAFWTHPHPKRVLVRAQRSGRLLQTRPQHPSGLPSGESHVKIWMMISTLSFFPLSRVTTVQPTVQHQECSVRAADRKQVLEFTKTDNRNERDPTQLRTSNNLAILNLLPESFHFDRYTRLLQSAFGLARCWKPSRMCASLPVQDEQSQPKKMY